MKRLAASGLCCCSRWHASLCTACCCCIHTYPPIISKHLPIHLIINQKIIISSLVNAPQRPPQVPICDALRNNEELLISLVSAKIGAAKQLFSTKIFGEDSQLGRSLIKSCWIRKPKDRKIVHHAKKALGDSVHQWSLPKQIVATFFTALNLILLLLFFPTLMLTVYFALYPILPRPHLSFPFSGFDLITLSWATGSG